MNLRHLEIFKAVMEAGTTARAAEQLLISQPAVSNQLRQFEAQLRLDLFERRGGRLHPTPEARQLYQKAEMVFNAFQAVRVLGDTLQAGSYGQLSIACTPTLGHTVMPNALDVFNRHYPNVPIHLDTPSNEQIITMVISGVAEFGLTITPLDHPGLESKTLYASPIYYAWPKDWGDLHGPGAVAPEDISSQRLIMYAKHSGIGQIMQSVFERERLTVQSWLEVRYVSTAFRFVELGAGATLIDINTARMADPGRVELRPVNTPQSVPLILTHRRDERLSIVAQHFINELLNGVGSVAESLSQPTF
jgi:DNA-binding transcriptional LysR family regulator